MRLFKARLSINIRTGFISGWEEKLHLELKGEHLKSFLIIYSCSFWFFLLYIDLHEHKRTSWMLYKGFIMLPFSIFKMHLLNWPIFHHLSTCREKIIVSPLAFMIMEHMVDLGKIEAPPLSSFQLSTLNKLCYLTSSIAKAEITLVMNLYTWWGLNEIVYLKCLEPITWILNKW